MPDFLTAAQEHLTEDKLTTLSSQRYSDLVDADGHQYVDLVMEGGGMLGFALLGYVWVLEKCGLRFWSIAGTSAGSIAAMLLVCLGPKQEAKAEKVLEKLGQLDTSTLMDGDDEFKRLFREYREKTLTKFGVARAAFVPDSLAEFLRSPKFDPDWDAAYRARGLFRGEAFLQWLVEVLDTAEKPVSSLHDLDQMLKQSPDLTVKPDRRRRGTPSGKPPAGFQSKLVIVAADVTTESLVFFPEMANRYWPDPSRLHPAYLVRASMSIPVFFEPFEEVILRDKPSIKEAWKGTPYETDIPPRVTFLDGGMLSNFPINAFHAPGKVPTHPTFGVKLNPTRQQDTSTLAGLLGAAVNTARHSLDKDFLKKNRDYDSLVGYVDTEKIGWLDFEMTYRNKVRLFAQGAKAAVEFLEKFHWDKYKDLRDDLARSADVMRLRTEAEDLLREEEGPGLVDVILDGVPERVRVLHRAVWGEGQEVTVVEEGEDTIYSRFQVEGRKVIKTFYRLTKAGKDEFTKVVLKADNDMERYGRGPEDEEWIRSLT